MRLLVTGCAGFIGSQLSARLLDAGHAVCGIDNFDETLYPAARHRQQLTPLLLRSGFTFREGDILDEGLVERQLAGVDVVVHLAALAGVRPSLQQARRYLRVNVEGTQAVLDACARAAVRRIVFASSSSVYGARSQAPFCETDEAIAPASPYAASKRAGELICATHAALHGASICALRFFTVYGPWQRPEMAIARFAQLIRDGQPMSLFRTSGLSAESARDYTFIDDILDGTIAAIDRTGQPIEPFRVYNLGGARTTTLEQLVQILEMALKQRAIVEWRDEQPGDVPLTCADTARAAAELSYAPRVSLEAGIARYCAWLQDLAPRQ
jgi:UDP-glucuronate 4-epimerase